MIACCTKQRCGVNLQGTAGTLINIFDLYRLPTYLGATIRYMQTTVIRYDDKTICCPLANALILNITPTPPKPCIVHCGPCLCCVMKPSTTIATMFPVFSSLLPSLDLTV